MQPRGRPWEANRIFQLALPKNPIHYIENGFEPTSAITDWTSVVVTANTVQGATTTSVLTTTFPIEFRDNSDNVIETKTTSFELIAGSNAWADDILNVYL